MSLNKHIGRWTDIQKDFLKRNIELPIPELSKRLNKNNQSIARMINSQGMSKRKKILERKYLMKNGHGKSREALMKELGRAEEHIEELVDVPELNWLAINLGMKPRMTMEEIVAKSEAEFMRSYISEVRARSKVDFFKKCKVVEMQRRKSDVDKRKACNSRSGMFVKEHDTFYVFETDGGYIETFLKIDLVTGEKKVFYI